MEGSQSCQRAHAFVHDETDPRVALDQSADFHDMFANMMPHERGAARAADAITEALPELEGSRVAADRLEMSTPLDRYIRDDPTWFR